MVQINISSIDDRVTLSQHQYIIEIHYLCDSQLQCNSRFSFYKIVLWKAKLIVFKKFYVHVALYQSL